MLGRKYTWTDFQDHAVHSRLARFLISIQWLDKFKVLQWDLPRLISDHCPITLLEDDRNWGPRPFRFMDIWLSNPGCMKLARESWNELHVNGWAGFMII